MALSRRSFIEAIGLGTLLGLLPVSWLAGLRQERASHSCLTGNSVEPTRVEIPGHRVVWLEKDEILMLGQTNGENGPEWQ